MGHEGTIVLNYRLVRKLGEGGFGAVYLAEHTELGRQVACKVLHSQYAQDGSIVERFFREAKAVTAIGHRAIVSVENFGTLDSGEPFYLMEFFAGSALEDLATERRLTSEQLVAIFDPIADALSAAHARGIIHRDLKPDNIMVRMDGARVADVRLLDFGIAKLLDGESYSMTGGAMGTPSYMAPEQALDAKHIDARADVYAFGATLYAAVSGRPPFSGTTAAAILVRAQTEAAEPLDRHRAGASPELVAATARCLAKQPTERPPTIAAAWAELRAGLLRTPLAGVVATTPHAPTIMATDMRATQIPPTVPEPNPAGRRAFRPMYAVAALAVAIAAAGGIALALHGRGSDASDAPVAVAAAPVDAALPDAALPDAALPDAALPDAVLPDAALPDAAAPPERTPPTRTPPARTPPARTPPAPKTSACTEASFQPAIDAGTEATINAALTRLRGCRDKLDPAAFTRIQQALVGKL